MSRLYTHVLGSLTQDQLEKSIDRLEGFPQSQADSSAKGRSLNSTKGLGTTSDQTPKKTKTLHVTARSDSSVVAQRMQDTALPSESHVQGREGLCTDA